MARVTVEDCLDRMDNRFELVLSAARRARQVANGVQPQVDWENDKPTVVALREIAAGFVTSDILKSEPEGPADPFAPRGGFGADEVMAEAGPGDVPEGSSGEDERRDDSEAE